MLLMTRLSHVENASSARPARTKWARSGTREARRPFVQRSLVQRAPFAIAVMRSR
jgi:hypothetical protein